MIGGISMHCEDAPQMEARTNNGTVWIDLKSGKPGPYQPQSKIAVFVAGRSLDVVQRAAEAFNAVMSGATLLPVQVPALPAELTDMRREANRSAAERDDETASDLVDADEEPAF